MQTVVKIASVVAIRVCLPNKVAIECWRLADCGIRIVHIRRSARLGVRFGSHATQSIHCFGSCLRTASCGHRRTASDSAVGIRSKVTRGGADVLIARRATARHYLTKFDDPAEPVKLLLRGLI